MNGGPAADAAPRHRILLALSTLCTLAFLVWVLWFCRFGVDFRDEGSYLAWMSEPSKYDVSVTQFGFVYHPLFELVGRDIVAVRRLNLLMTFGIAWLLSSIVLGQSAGLQVSLIVRRVLAAALACASLSFLHTWVPTPSYNWLTLQSLMLSAVGLLLVARGSKRGGRAGWLLIAVAGWLTFMAKPTSAALLAVIACSYLFLTGRLNWRPMLLAASIALLLLLASAVWIDGSVMGFVERYRMGIDFAALMGGGHKLSLFLRLGELKLETFTRDAILGGFVALVALFLLASSAWRWSRRIAASGGLLLGLASLAVFAGQARGLIPPEEYHKGLLPAVIPIAALLVLLILRRWPQRNSQGRQQWALIGLLGVLPYAYVFGTVNNYWWQVSQATFFWVLAGALMVTMPAHTTSSRAPTRPFVLPVVVLALASQFLVAAIVQTGIEAPYGQPTSLRDEHHTVRVGQPPTSLRLSREIGGYLDQAIQVSQAAGFVPGSPMLDLTGRSPATLYAMAASNTSQAWMIGGYPGSDALARASMVRVSCEELSRAWLLVQPTSPTSLSPALLNNFGADLDRDYENAGSIVMDDRVADRLDLWPQFLLKPRRPPEIAQEACMRARSSRP